ncbi:MAG: LacI family DNA-binding transcriptional regulator, partial [Chloroflexota bacterium]
MPTTLKDISKQSGYSVTTVSRALTGYDDVSSSTRAHILKIADQLGYQPNHAARQLQGQHTMTLGLIMPERMPTYEDDFFSVLLKGITYEAANNGYDVLTSAAHPNQSELDTYKRFVEGKRV